MKIHDLPRHRRPREKLLARGGGALSDAELLAVILRTGFHGKSALEVAQRLLKERDVSELLHTPLAELAKRRGVGMSRATVLMAAIELASRSLHTSPATLTSPQQLAASLQYLSKYAQERVVALYLNARNHVIYQATISVGTVNSALIHPREVFAPAIEHKAASVILAHNHPSQDARPSEEDIIVTGRLVAAGELLDIPLLDHLIVTATGWTSFKQEQLL